MPCSAVYACCPGNSRLKFKKNRFIYQEREGKKKLCARNRKRKKNNQKTWVGGPVMRGAEAIPNTTAEKKVFQSKGTWVAKKKKKF
jgi:hypothetical protein